MAFGYGMNKIFAFWLDQNEKKSDIRLAKFLQAWDCLLMLSDILILMFLVTLAACELHSANLN